MVHKAPTIFVHAFLWLGLAAIGCAKHNTPSPQIGPIAAEDSGPPLTDEECKKFANDLEKAIASGDAVALNNLLNWDAMLEKAMAGVDVSAADRRSFIKGFKDGFNQTGLAANASAAIKEGGRYTLLRIHTSQGEKRALFRFITPSGGVNYNDWILARLSNDHIEAVDSYNLATGEKVSEAARRAFLSLAAQSSRGLLTRLQRNEQEIVKSQPTILRMTQSLRAKKFPEGLAAYEQLPASLKKDKSVLIIRLGLAQGAGEKEYFTALKDILSFYPNDPSFDLHAVDVYFIAKQYTKAIESVDRLDRSLGGDPYLKVIRANIYIASGDFDKARTSCQEAIKEEPTLQEAYWRLVRISLQEKDFAETGRLLMLLAQQFQVQFEDLTKVPDYAEFVRSPEYKQWLKSREKK